MNIDIEALPFMPREETDPTRYGYPAGCDLFDCLWYEIVNVAMHGINWRTQSTFADRQTA